MITRLPIVDDTGDGTSGTAITAAWWTQVQDMIDARWSILPVTATGVVNNLAINEADVIVLNNAAPLTINGIAAPVNPVKPGKTIRFVSIGTAPVYFVHFHGGVLPVTDRMLNYATSGPTPIMGGTATYTHGGNVWYLTQHEQGAWLDVPITPALFTAPGATYTPHPSCVYRYRLSGRTLEISFQLSGGLNVNAPNWTVALPPPYAAAVGMGFVWARIGDNGVAQDGMASISSPITFYSSVGGGGWNATTPTGNAATANAAVFIL